MEAYQVVIHVKPQFADEDLTFIVPTLHCVTNVLLAVEEEMKQVNDATITKILL